MELCIVIDCELPPIYKCACTEPESRFCDLHATEHIESVGSHVLLTNYIGLAPWKIALSRQCNICIQKYRVSKNKVAQVLRDNIQKLSQMTLKFIQETTIMEMLYFEAVDFMRTNDKIINKLKYTPAEEFILKYLEKPNEVGSHFLQAEDELMKEIDLKTRLDESSAKVIALNEEVRKRIKEVYEVKQKFEKANKLREKNFYQIKSGLERTIKGKTYEMKIVKEECSREINKINQSFNEIQQINKQKSEEISNINKKLVEITKLNQKYMSDIAEMNKIIEEKKHTIRQKDQEILTLNKTKTQKINDISLRSALIQSQQNQFISELQTKIKELQIINDQKCHEIDGIRETYQEILLNNQPKTRENNLRSAQIQSQQNKDISELHTRIKELQIINDQKGKEIDSIKEKYQQIIMTNKMKTQEINDINLRSAQIQSKQNKVIMELQIRIDDLQINNNKKSKEINDIKEKLKASNEEKNFEIQQVNSGLIGGRFENDRDSLIIQQKNEELRKIKKELQEYKFLVNDKENRKTILEQQLNQAISDKAEANRLIFEWRTKLHNLEKELNQVILKDEKNRSAIVELKKLNDAEKRIKKNIYIPITAIQILLHIAFHKFFMQQ